MTTPQTAKKPAIMQGKTSIDSLESVLAKSLETARVAFQWGFKCHEKGLSLEQALQRFDQQMNP